MVKSFRRVLVVAVAVAMCASVCAADSIWDYEAVKADGNGCHPLVNAPAYGSDENVIPTNKVTVQGIALAGMNDLWSADGGGAQYAVFIQDGTADRGGMEIWAGSYWWPTGGWRPAQYASVSAGDLVQVTGFLQDHSGKVFINDRHGTDLDVCPVVQIIGHPGVPDPELIPSLSNCNYFDQTRNDGGERYQTRLAMLHGVQATGGSWANNGTITISDATGAGALYIPPMVSLTGSGQPTGKFSVVGIYDQEDGGSGTPTQYHGNYRMILRSTSDIAISLDACRDVRGRTDGEQVALARKTVSRVYNGSFFVQDPDRSGGVEVVSDHPVTPGDVVSIMGTVSARGGQNVLVAKYVAKSRNGAGPLFVNGRALRGASGLDVFGLLVKCSGRIGDSLGNGLYQFTADDGSAITLNSNGYAVPAQNTLVTVTAVASGNSSAPVLLLGSANDIAPVGQ